MKRVLDIFERRGEILKTADYIRDWKRKEKILRNFSRMLLM